MTYNVVDFVKYKNNKRIERVLDYMAGLQTQRRNNTWADFRYVCFLCMLYEKNYNDTRELLTKHFPDLDAAEYYEWITLCAIEFEEVASNDHPTIVDPKR